MVEYRELAVNILQFLMIGSIGSTVIELSMDIVAGGSSNEVGM